MNYLGHAYLSFGTPGILLGNIAGDHYKGLTVLEGLPEDLRKGVVLHRKIDQFTDMHFASRQAMLLFRQDYGLYAGAITDTLFDHFLANDGGIFTSDSDLRAFSHGVYAQLDTMTVHFPEKFGTYYGHMKQHDWLFNYHSVKGVEQSLGGLSRRAKYMKPPGRAYEIFLEEYYKINQFYNGLIVDLVRFVRTEMEA